MKFKLLLLFLFPFFSLYAQDNDNLDYLYLKGDNFVKGQIIDTLPDGSIMVKLLSGNEMIIQQGDIINHKVTHRQYYNNPKKYYHQTRGVYFSAGLIIRPSEYKRHRLISDVPINMGFQFSGGYQINNYLSVGLCAESEINNAIYLPLYLEVRGNLSMKRLAPIYSVKLGHSILVGGGELPTHLIRKDDILFFPSIGLRLASLKGINTELSAGYRWNRIKFSDGGFYLPVYSDYYTDTFKIWLGDFVIRFGCTF